MLTEENNITYEALVAVAAVVVAAVAALVVAEVVVAVVALVVVAVETKAVVVAMSAFAAVDAVGASSGHGSHVYKYEIKI